ncbi:MAG: ATP-binding protein [Myxococcaceae bacterium]
MRALSTTELGGLLELLDAVAFRVDPESLDVSLHGTHAEALLGHPTEARVAAADFWGVSVPTGDAQLVLSAVRAVAVDGRPRAVDHRVRMPGRAEQWFRTSLRCDVTTGAAGREVLGVMQNVTSDWLNERQWRETEAWLAALGDNLPFDFWICDRIGRYVLQNPASERSIGNVLGRRPEDVAQPPEKLEHWLRCVPRALGGATLREDVEYLGPEGRMACTRVIAPVRDGAEIVGVLGVEIDITAQKQVEDRLRQSVDELERAQRTLVKKEQMAALGEMAAVVAHEVRNPLGVIANVLELLRRQTSVHVDHVELVGVLREEVTRLERLVANLLDFVRPMYAAPEPRPLAPVLEAALAEAMRAATDGARVQPVLHLDPALPPIEMDAGLVTLAIANVLRNAVQAMTEGGDLQISAETTPEAGGRARISIRDRGTGIPPEIRGRIFEPFFTTRATGSGLGLAIVRRIVDQHRGQIEVLSEPGQGTTCVIHLPFRQPT